MGGETLECCCGFHLVNCGMFLIDVIACDFTDLTEQAHDITPSSQVIGYPLKLICPYVSMLHYPHLWWKRVSASGNFFAFSCSKSHLTEIEEINTILILLLGLIPLYSHMPILPFCWYISLCIDFFYTAQIKCFFWRFNLGYRTWHCFCID